MSTVIRHNFVFAILPAFVFLVVILREAEDLLLSLSLSLSLSLRLHFAFAFAFARHSERSEESLYFARSACDPPKKPKNLVKPPNHASPSFQTTSVCTLIPLNPIY
jgi:hypothetical protein